MPKEVRIQNPLWQYSETQIRNPKISAMEALDIIRKTKGVGINASTQNSDLQKTQKIKTTVKDTKQNPFINRKTKKFKEIFFSKNKLNTDDRPTELNISDTEGFYDTDTSETPTDLQTTCLSDTSSESGSLNCIDSLEKLALDGIITRVNNIKAAQEQWFRNSNNSSDELEKITRSCLKAIENRLASLSEKSASIQKLMKQEKKTKATVEEHFKKLSKNTQLIDALDKIDRQLIPTYLQAINEIYTITGSKKIAEKFDKWLDKDNHRLEYPTYTTNFDEAKRTHEGFFLHEGWKNFYLEDRSRLKTIEDTAIHDLTDWQMEHVKNLRLNKNLEDKNNDKELKTLYSRVAFATHFNPMMIKGPHDYATCIAILKDGMQYPLLQSTLLKIFKLKSLKDFFEEIKNEELFKEKIKVMYQYMVNRASYPLSHENKKLDYLYEKPLKPVTLSENLSAYTRIIPPEFLTGTYVASGLGSEVRLWLPSDSNIGSIAIQYTIQNIKGFDKLPCLKNIFLCWLEDLNKHPDYILYRNLQAAFIMIEKVITQKALYGFHLISHTGFFWQSFHQLVEEGVQSNNNANQRIALKLKEYLNFKINLADKKCLDKTWPSFIRINELKVGLKVLQKFFSLPDTYQLSFEDTLKMLTRDSNDIPQLDALQFRCILSFIQLATEYVTFKPEEIGNKECFTLLFKSIDQNACVRKLLLNNADLQKAYAETKQYIQNQPLLVNIDLNSQSPLDAILNGNPTISFIMIHAHQWLIEYKNLFTNLMQSIKQPFMQNNFLMFAQLYLAEGSSIPLPYQDQFKELKIHFEKIKKLVDSDSSQTVNKEEFELLFNRHFGENKNSQNPLAPNYLPVNLQPMTSVDYNSSSLASALETYFIYEQFTNMLHIQMKDDPSLTKEFNELKKYLINCKKMTPEYQLQQQVQLEIFNTDLALKKREVEANSNEAKMLDQQLHYLATFKRNQITSHSNENQKTFLSFPEHIKEILLDSKNINKSFVSNTFDNTAIDALENLFYQYLDEAYQAIKLAEFDNNFYSKKEKGAVTSINYLRFMNRTDKISRFISYKLITSKDKKVFVEKFIEIAERAFALGNFHLAAVIAQNIDLFGEVILKDDEKLQARVSKLNTIFYPKDTKPYRQELEQAFYEGKNILPSIGFVTQDLEKVSNNDNKDLDFGWIISQLKESANKLKYNTKTRVIPDNFLAFKNYIDLFTFNLPNDDDTRSILVAITKRVKE